MLFSRAESYVRVKGSENTERELFAINDNERRNMEVVKEYMSIAYSPEDCKGEESVAHLVAQDSRFISPATFPNVHTVTQYAAVPLFHCNFSVFHLPY